MTVCVAAITDNYTAIVGASDRMLGMGETQFQPEQPKIWEITTSIAAMVASNNISLQYTIHQNVLRVVAERILADPLNWWQVKDVAELYRTFYREELNRQIETQILHPKGIDYDTYLNRQTSLAPIVLERILNEIDNLAIQSTSILLSGIDTQPGNRIAPHLYVIRNGNVSCQDVPGFAAIGSGSRVANSELQVNNYSGNRDGANALFTVLWAKKRAERAQGVGPATDMFVIGQLGQYVRIKDDFVKELEGIYRKRRRAEEKVSAISQEQIKRWLASRVPPPQQGPQTPPQPT